MKKTMLLLAVMGVFAFSTTVSAANYRSVFYVFDGYPSASSPCQQLPTDPATLCGGEHAGINGYITFKSNRDGTWDVTVYLFHACPGFPYQVKSNGHFLGDNPVSEYDGTTGILIPTTLERNKKGKLTGFASGTLSCHLTKDAAKMLGGNISVFADCPDSGITGYYPDGTPESCTHFNLLYTTNWAFLR